MTPKQDPPASKSRVHRNSQIEIWLSTLVRKLLKRGSFRPVDELEAKVRACIDYYNQTPAKPFAWTDRGKALAA